MSTQQRYSLLEDMISHCLKEFPEGRKLHGGQISQYFVDVPLIFQYPRSVASLMNQMLTLFTTSVSLHNIGGLISPDNGGTFIAAALQSFLSINHDIYLPLYRVDKTEGIQKIPYIQKRGFVLIDDVITTGKSLLPIIEHVKKFDGTILQAITVVNRSAEGGYGDRLLAKEGVLNSSVFTLEELLLLASVKKANKENG